MRVFNEGDILYAWQLNEVLSQLEARIIYLEKFHPANPDPDTPTDPDIPVDPDTPIDPDNPQPSKDIEILIDEEENKLVMKIYEEGFSAEVDPEDNILELIKADTAELNLLCNIIGNICTIIKE